MYEDEYDLFSIKQFTNLFILDDLEYDGLLFYIPDNLMNEMLSLCNDFEIYILMHEKIETKKFDVYIINNLTYKDMQNTTTIADRNKLLPNDMEIKVKFYFKTIKQQANFKIRYTGY